jgi:hypothetical protein
MINRRNIYANEKIKGSKMVLKNKTFESSLSPAKINIEKKKNNCIILDYNK